MTTVVVSPTNVATFPEGGGHFWVYLQYVQGLRHLGCDVYWLERFEPVDDGAERRRMLEVFTARMRRYGLTDKAILYAPRADGELEYIAIERKTAESVIRRADLLVNFDYRITATVLARFRRTALVDIDPGLLQHWIAKGELSPPAHDAYFTTGATVGRTGQPIPDVDVRWTTIRPAVALDSWPYAFDPDSEAFTTISSWWGRSEWLTVDGRTYDNNKRAAFLEYATLPTRTRQPLELALNLGADDASDRRQMESLGWRVRHAAEVAATPAAYADYIRGSRGEFSCVKPSCRRFRNAWMSDRSLCYLASGKPVVLQDAGQREFVPEGEGIFFFSTLEEAAEAFAAINRDYERHCRAARLIAEDLFDARRTAETVLSAADGR